MKIKLTVDAVNAYKTYDFAEGEVVTVGRDTDNKITVLADGLSRHHAKIYFKDGAWVVEDVGSTNGTFCRGMRISGAMKLEDAEIIRLGITAILVRLEQEAAGEVDSKRTTASLTPAPVVEPIKSEPPKPVVEPIKPEPPKPVVEPVKPEPPKPVIEPVGMTPVEMEPVEMTPVEEAPAKPASPVSPIKPLIPKRPTLPGAGGLKPGLKLPPKPGAAGGLKPGLKLPTFNGGLKPGLKLPPKPGAAAQ